LEKGEKWRDSQRSIPNVQYSFNDPETPTVSFPSKSNGVVAFVISRIEEDSI
jgi:hypothetical protein